jgi:hypothetical protein
MAEILPIFSTGENQRILRIAAAAPAQALRTPLKYGDAAVTDRRARAGISAPNALSSRQCLAPARSLAVKTNCLKKHRKQAENTANKPKKPQTALPVY